tara:strand:- start:35 stop:319 length:285 start_codon:yes stop_codon:yes gene_type:complete
MIPPSTVKTIIIKLLLVIQTDKVYYNVLNEKVNRFLKLSQGLVVIQALDDLVTSSGLHEHIHDTWIDVRKVTTDQDTDTKDDNRFHSDFPVTIS